MRAWRWPARLVIVAAIVVAFVIDSRVDPPVAEVVQVAAVDEPRVVPAATALTSTWYCPTVAISSDEGGVEVSAVVRVANLQAVDVPVTITTMSPTSQPESFIVTVEAGSIAEIDMAGRVDADRVAVIVEAPGGGIAVDRLVTSSLGADLAPCAPGAGQEWTIAAGDTQRDAVERLVVFNPFPDDAVVDVLFATEVEAGAFQAADLRAIVVPGEDVVTIDLGDAVRRRDQVSVAMVARSGRVIVDRVQTFDGSEGRFGMAVALGSVAASEVWYQPGVVVDAGTVAYVHVHNPNDVPAEIDVAAESAVLFAAGDPVGLTVPAMDSIVIPIVATGTREEGLRLDVDAGVMVGIVVESANGVPVVVDLELEVSPVEVTPPETTTTVAPTTVPPTTVAPTTAVPTTVPTTATDGEAVAETTTTTVPPTTTTVPPTTTTTTTTTTPDDFELVATVRDPRAANGLAQTLFVSHLAQRWLVIGVPDAEVAVTGLVHNPGPAAVELVISRLDGTLIERIALQPGSSVGVPVPVGVEAILVETQQPVAASVMAERVGGLGVMLATAFPLD